MPRPLLTCILLLTACGGAPSRDASRPNVVLVTLDTTRRDHVSCYGYSETTTPNLDRLAADGLRYDRAYAVSSWTLPTHASIFTGKFPSSHGSRYDPEGALNLVMEGGIRGSEAWSRYRANPISSGEATLAKVLGARGYATHAIVAGPWLKRVFGLWPGFEGYDDGNFASNRRLGEMKGRPAEDVTRAAIEFVDGHAGEPFFLFLNYYDPHAPYTPPREYLAKYWDGPKPPQETLEYLLARYDAEIEYTDHHLGRLIEHLQERGLYEDTWIVVTSDHGELMGELGMRGHGDSLSQSEIHVPLVIKEAGAERRRGVDDRPVQQVDLMPMLLEGLGIEPPEGLQGRAGGRGELPVLAEVYPLAMMNDAATKPWRQLGDWRSLIEGRYKFVWGGRGRHLLFDLERDPGELHDLSREQPEVAAAMQARLEAAFAALPPPPALGQVDQPSEAELKALGEMGYLGDH